MPGGESVLFTIWTGTTTYAAVVSLDDGVVRTVGEGGSNYRYVEPGYLVSGREGALVAEAFDLASLQSTGPEIPVADDVMMSPEDAFVYYDTSSSGMLAFRTGSSLTRIVWVDRNDGAITEAWPRSGRFSSVRLSHDTRYIAADVTQTIGGYTVVLLDREAGTPQVISAGTDDLTPVFSPDDRTVVYTSATDDGYAILSAGNHRAFVRPDRRFQIGGRRSPTADGRLLPHIVDGERLLFVRYEDAGLESHYFNVIPNLPALLERVP